MNKTLNKLQIKEKKSQAEKMDLIIRTFVFQLWNKEIVIMKLYLVNTGKRFVSCNYSFKMLWSWNSYLDNYNRNIS